MVPDWLLDAQEAVQRFIAPAAYAVRGSNKPA